jgi:(p)ppGpp synthase/HD superfamily hydrolase
MRKKSKISLIEKAMRIAVLAHQGQKRKLGGLPYIVHPFMVALKLAKYNFPDEVIAGALVHDLLEDTDFSEEELKKELGKKVFEIVKAVTQDESLPWEEKKRKYIENIKQASKEAKAVAVADKIHNLESLLIGYKEQGPKVWEKFTKGRDKIIWFQEEVLKAIKKNWKHPLVKEYENLVEKLKKLK